MDQSNPENVNALTEFFGEIISKYTRAQAIADGVLVDISAKAAECGYLHPFALTRALWGTIERIPSQTPWQDHQGRLWDCLWMGRVAIRQAPAGVSRVEYRVMLSAEGRRKRYKTLVLDLGPGDQGEPVFTLGFPGDF